MGRAGGLARPAARSSRDPQKQIPITKFLSPHLTNWELLNSHFSWDRFAQQVVDTIEGHASPALGPKDWKRKWMLRWPSLISPSSTIQPLNLARFAKVSLARLRQEYGQGATKAG